MYFRNGGTGEDPGFPVLAKMYVKEFGPVGPPPQKIRQCEAIRLR